MERLFRTYPVLTLVILLPLLILAGCQGNAQKQAQTQGGANGRGGAGRGGRGGPQTVPVAVVAAEKRDFPVYLEGLGSVTAFNTVVVKSRVDGQLMKVAFQEGQEVKQGELLAVIDPRPFEVALSQAQANLFKDQSSLKDAQINLERYRDLFKQGIISQQQLDTQSATTGQFEGAVRADQAAVDNAKLNLTYTRVTAPVNGRVGLRQVDIGNMVHASDQNGLLVLTQLQPITVIFTLPEDQLPAVAKHMRGGTLQVEARSRDDLTQIASGRLLTIDNQIDPTTGTARLKAVFTNEDRALWPNQFVNIRLQLEVAKDQTVIPTAAIQRGPQGTYVYVVKSDNTADLRTVSLGLTQGNMSTVAQGLNPGENVVVDGADKLQPGSKVEARVARPAGPAQGGQQNGAAAANGALPGGGPEGGGPANYGGAGKGTWPRGNDRNSGATTTGPAQPTGNPRR